ncbi:hypothetical protein [Phenylobacterium sp.]|uniref:tetratricopeptide repeat protein n=1 Tax=Phenylobacterium sp. TaxID=1871053 RepID=UPI002E3407E4|nr:hypothetical protein [Phenylobacterium sp.]HEX3365616.1 hypothetical protein [Phenylobacterium sp.]
MKIPFSRRISKSDDGSLGDPFFSEYGIARDRIASGDHAGRVEMERLAKAGSLSAILYLADALRTGWLYEKDLELSEEWYRVAVTMGSHRAIYSIGQIQLAKDEIVEAMNKFRIGVDANYPPSIDSLAGILYNRIRTESSIKEAKSLWWRAASMGHVYAIRNLARLYISGREGVLLIPFGLIVLIYAGVSFLFNYRYDRYSYKMR